MTPAPHAPHPAAARLPFAPTEYTAALMLQVRQRGPHLKLDSVLEIGTGSGVVLLSMLALGARQALGVDIEAAAVACTQALVTHGGHAARTRVVQGDMWRACGNERFDLVVANLPQFPLRQALADGRLPSWSCGGPDGRSLVDPFLQGLPAHLSPGGRALMTHNAFIDLDRTRDQLRALGCGFAVRATVSVPLPLAKLQGLCPDVLARWLGRGLHRVGDFSFADFHVLEIADAAELPDGAG